VLARAYMERAHLQGSGVSGARLTSFQIVDQVSGRDQLTLAQVKSTKGWETAHWSPEARAKLGLPPEESSEEPTSDAAANQGEA
jgi:hypothetical protein